MPTVNIQISNVRCIKNNTSFIAIFNNKAIERTLNINDIDNWQDFASWLINQIPDYELLPNKEKLLNITFHSENVIDPETGIEMTTKVVDNVVVD